ncbi:MAG TPA: sorbosone dehydrogenase family protein [Stellaceae bacterium]|jgi:glucose/arabinose dehydrogenase|nr:sorbosone dehydrogenase family protein [Stellaceae bacterium]
MRNLILAAALCGAVAASAWAADQPRVLTGAAAFGDWRQDAPGTVRKISAADLPAPFASPSARDTPRIVREPDGAKPSVPRGFSVARFADHLEGPRAIRVAPNGDVFVAESRAGAIVVLRPGKDAPEHQTFATGLDSPYGIAFWPPGPNPQYVYVGNTQSVVRFPYRNGDLRASGPAQTLVAPLAETGGGHWTRDIAFSPDGKQMYAAVGSSTNDAENMPKWSPDQIRPWEARHGLGAGWEHEANRADVRVFDPEGHGGKALATGIRNCAGLAIDPATGTPWCATNERDGLGDNLPPDYVTRVKEGGFYGWPWYYIGDHPDPRHKGERPDLAGKVAMPDVLIQPHSAPLQIAFYDGAMFPSEYRGNAFVTLHGSWNRAQRTGYKLVRIVVKNGVPTGEYEDFLTGFVTDDGGVWGRPVGVAVMKDGSLLVGEDGNGTIWRVSYTGGDAAAR